MVLVRIKVNPVKIEAHTGECLQNQEIQLLNGENNRAKSVNSKW